MEHVDENKLVGSSKTLDHLRQWFAAEVQPRGIARTMGIRGTVAEAGRVAMEGFPTEDHYNPMGIVHGGYSATMLDSALALAVYSVIEAGMAYSTSNLNITYLRAMTKASAPITAEATVTHRTKRTAMATASLHDAEGKLCAHATGTFLIYPAR